MADKYLLRVTAGPSYDTSTHVVLPVNTSQPTLIKSEHCTAQVKVRVQNYRGIHDTRNAVNANSPGLPRGSPASSPYFEHQDHIHDQYSIAFTFVPHQSVSGEHLKFGNDFERPIRDRLPTGFSYAFKIVRWYIDPGLDGDPYADKPFLYSPLLATISKLSIGEKVSSKSSDGSYDIPTPDDEPIEEGGTGQGEDVREEHEVPDDVAARKKWALQDHVKADWQWEEGRAYSGDFFNPYLDFNEFSLKLPGFSLPVLGHLGGEDSLRYTLKDTNTDEVYFVVVFTLLLREDVEKEEAAAAGNAKEESTSEDKTEEPAEDDLD